MFVKSEIGAAGMILVTGATGRISSDFTALTGKPPESFQDFLVRVAPGGSAGG